MSKNEIVNEVVRQAEIHTRYDEVQARLFELDNEKLFLPGHTVVTYLELLSTSRYIVESNYNDFINLVTKCETELSFEIFEYTERKKHLFPEILRFLHNYLSSVQSLIHHTKVMRLALSNDELNIFWGSEIKRLLSNDCSIFVKHFRNYVQHCEIPFLHSDFILPSGITDEDFQENIEEYAVSSNYKIFLDTKKLLKSRSKAWNERSRRYIRTFGEELKLDSLFSEYQTLNSDFYSRFHDKVCSIYENEIKEVDHIENEERELFDEQEKLLGDINPRHHPVKRFVDYFTSVIQRAFLA